MKLGLFMGIMMLMFMSMISFSSNVVKLEYEEIKIQNITRTVPGIWRTLIKDNSRLSALSKINNIINKYNPRLANDQKYAIANEIYRMSVKYENLDVDLICATITHESALTWRKNVISPAGAMGLMQIMPPTGIFLSENEGIKWTQAEEILYNPIYNIRLGCRYLSSLIEMYQLDGGLAAYNGGPKRAAMWLASGRDDKILYEETRGYIPAILNLYENFRK